MRDCPDNPELSAAARRPLHLPLTPACPGHHSGPATQDTELEVCHLEVQAEGGTCYPALLSFVSLVSSNPLSSLLVFACRDTKASGDPSGLPGPKVRR